MTETLVIHRALAPYRIDLFNEIYEATNADIYFEYDMPIEQSFQSDILHSRVRFPYKILPKSLRWLPNLRLSLFGILKKGKYKTIFCSEFNMITLLLFVYKKLFNPRLKIITICDDNQYMAISTSLLHNTKPKRLLMSMVDAMIMCDRRAIVIYRGMYPKIPIYYMPIIQDETFLRAQVSLQSACSRKLREDINKDNKDVKLVLFVGRLSEEKNLQQLVYTFTRYFAPSRYKLIIVGDGPDKDLLHRIVAETKSQDQVFLVGKKEGDELYTYYGSADVLILPSTREAFGAVVAEAMAIGLPAVCSDVCGCSSLVEEFRKEFVFSTGDNIAMCKSIEQALVDPAYIYRHTTLRPVCYPNSFHNYMKGLISFCFS